MIYDCFNSGDLTVHLFVLAPISQQSTSPQRPVQTKAPRTNPIKALTVSQPNTQGDNVSSSQSMPSESLVSKPAQLHKQSDEKAQNQVS